MTRNKTKQIINTALISAFTLATALIWKEVIIDTIELFVPPSEEYIYKLGAAGLATIIAIIAIYLILKTESEAEKVIYEIKHHEHNK